MQVRNDGVVSWKADREHHDKFLVGWSFQQSLEADPGVHRRTDDSHEAGVLQ